jgi:hypothetical protein
MKRIRNLEELEAARLARRSVLCREGCHLSRYPAAFVMNRSAGNVLGMIRNGMFLYKPKKPLDPNAPVRKFQLKKPVPPPILCLPYYPEI